MALGSKFNAVTTTTQSGGSVTVPFTHVLRSETHYKDYPDGKKKSESVWAGRIYYYSSVSHNDTKYLIEGVTPQMVVCRHGGRDHLYLNAYGITREMNNSRPYAFQLRSGLTLRGFRIANETPFLAWNPFSSDATAIYNILNNDTDRNGPMYAANELHSLVVLVRIRSDNWTQSPYTTRGIGIDAVHALDLPAPPSPSSSNFLSFFLP